MGAQLLRQVGISGGTTREAEHRAVVREQRRPVLPVGRHGVAEGRCPLLGEVLGATEERSADPHHGEDAILHELLGHGEVDGRAPLVVLLISQLELAPIDAALGVDHREIGLDAAHDGGEVRRKRAGDVGDAAHGDQVGGHPRVTAAGADRALGIPARGKPDREREKCCSHGRESRSPTPRHRSPSPLSPSPTGAWPRAPGEAPDRRHA